MFGARVVSEFDEILADIDRDIARLAAQEIDAIPPLELGSHIKAISNRIDRLELERARRLEVFDRDGGYSASGDGSTATWLVRECFLPGHQADRQVKFARQMVDLESTQKAVESGQIGMQHGAPG